MGNRFILNKYLRWYLVLTGMPDSGEYTEKHHIVPRSMNGGDEPSNLIALTFRKHFLAHWLLTKCTSGRNQRKMRHAMMMMSRQRNGRVVSGWQYEIAKKAQRNAQIGTIDSKETRHKKSIGIRAAFSSPEKRSQMSASAKAYCESPEVRAKKSQLSKEVNARPEVKAAKRAAMLGRKLSSETRAKMRKAQSNRSPETIQKISAALTGRSLSPEHVAKLRAADRPPITDEAKTKMRDAQSKRAPRSEEHKARIASSVKAAHERREQGCDAPDDKALKARERAKRWRAENAERAKIGDKARYESNAERIKTAARIRYQAKKAISEAFS